MKKNTQAIPVDKNVFDFFTEIERQVGTSWIYIHNNVLQMFEKDKSFKGYAPLKRWEKDKTYTKLLKASFKKENGQYVTLYLKECIMKEDSNYYIIYIMISNDAKTSAPSDPEEVIFFKN